MQVLGTLPDMNAANQIGTRLFSRLPVLDWVEKYFTGVDSRLLRGCALVGVQHLLETTGSLFESLISSGLPAQNIFVLGKLYSANKAVEDRLRELGINVLENQVPRRFGTFCDQFASDVRNLWAMVEASGILDRVTQLIVLDDGGYAIAETPNSILDRLPVQAVEQTMSGLEIARDACAWVPIIDVASSAAKTLLEPHLIREAVFRRTASTIAKPSSFGVIGLGNIGQAVASALTQSGHPVFVFDKEKKNLPHDRLGNCMCCGTVSQVFDSADTIFGCTGSDFLAHEPWWMNSKGRKTLISCSSHDQEFRTVLRQLCPIEVRNSTELFATLEIPTAGGSMSILRGGFPINFDGSRESVPAADIQLTRGLLLAGTRQALKSARTALTGRQPLSARAQKSIAQCWFNANRVRKQSYPPDILRIFDEEDLIAVSGWDEPSGLSLNKYAHSPRSC